MIARGVAGRLTTQQFYYSISHSFFKILSFHLLFLLTIVVILVNGGVAPYLRSLDYLNFFTFSIIF